MEQAAITSATNRNDPDWNTISRDILCPLCDYNLRGLVEPRCPECGHRSTWKELLDPARQRHPWLFEHQDRRGIVALVRTFVKSQFPRAFWKGVDPIHRPRAGRLFLYWFIVSSFLVIELGTPYLTRVTKYYWGIHQARQERSAILQSGSGLLGGPMTKSVADAIAAGWDPYPMPWEAWIEIENRMPHLYRVAGHLCFILLFWPILTILSLMIFRQTLGQAKIRTIHVIRCAIYSADAGLIWAWPLAWAMAWAIDPLTNSARGIIFFAPYVLIIFVAMMALFTYRLSCAYRLYLRFPAPVWTCLASQLIVALALLAIMPWVIMF